MPSHAVGWACSAAFMPTRLPTTGYWLLQQRAYSRVLLSVVIAGIPARAETDAVRMDSMTVDRRAERA